VELDVAQRGEAGLVDLRARIQLQFHSSRRVSSSCHQPHNGGTVFGDLRTLLAAGDRLEKHKFRRRAVPIRVLGEEVMEFCEIPVPLLSSCRTGGSTEASLPPPP